MKKLKLDVSDLRIDSFVPRVASDAEGTVIGNSGHTILDGMCQYTDAYYCTGTGGDTGQTCGPVDTCEDSTPCFPTCNGAYICQQTVQWCTTPPYTEANPTYCGGTCPGDC
jgi:hypothetical protein